MDLILDTDGGDGTVSKPKKDTNYYGRDVGTKSSWQTSTIPDRSDIREPVKFPSYAPVKSSEDELWANRFESYPMASSSRDEYGLDDDEDEDIPQKCGWSRFTPRCLQVCLSVKAYLVVMSIISFIQLMTVYGLTAITITTIERRFHLSSFQSGAIMSAYQFATMAFTVFITYAGEHRHKPQWVGSGLTFLWIGSVLFALPHFLSGKYEYQDYSVSNETVCPMPNTSNGSLSSDMCQLVVNSESGTDDNASDYFWLFIVAQLFNSLGSAPLYTLGITYMDDNLSTKNFGFYMGIFNAIVSFGPAMGYLTGVATLSLYTEFYKEPDSIAITPDNPLWVGAWWLGFLISACLIAVLSLLIIAFPKSLPGIKRIKQERKDQAHRGSEFTARPGFGNSVRDFPRALAKIFTNIPFICLCLAAVTEYFIAAGLMVFAPKFMESQFNINSRDIGIYVGVVGMTAYSLGSIITGCIIKRFDMQFAGMMKLCLCALLATMVAGLAFVMHCPNVPLAGVSVRYINTSIALSVNEQELVADCNSHCACSNNFEPICGEDSVMYFSPCHAGCTTESEIDGTLVYSDCWCINYDGSEGAVFFNDTVSRTSLADGIISRTAKPGRCQTQCSKQWPYLVLLWIYYFFGTLVGIPAWIATIRCVSHSQRAFALGVHSLLYGGLGTAPAPIVFGIIIDLACIKWDTSSCNVRGACWMYDNKTFAHSLLALIMSFKFLSAIFLLLSLCCYKPPTDAIGVDDVYRVRRKRIPSQEL